MVTPADARRGAKPVLMTFTGPVPQRRWTVFFRIILVIPQIVVLYALTIAAEVLTVLGWFGALFTGRLPGFVGDFMSGYLRWAARVWAYMSLLTDVYPPFTLNDVDYPVRVAVDPTGRLNRFAVFFRIILVIPANVVAAVAQAGASVVLVVAWLIVLVSGRMPPSLYQAYASVVRFQARLWGYFTLLTAEYPWGLFGDREIDGAAGPPGTQVAVGYGSAPPGPSAPWGFAASPWQGQSAPVHADVFTFGGDVYLWGYSADRRFCGIWQRAQPNAAGTVWPVEDQRDAWTRFTELEPRAIEYTGPQPGAAPYHPAYGPGPGTADQGTSPPAPAWGSPGDSRQWLLSLSKGAKQLVAFFVVIGVVGYGAYLPIVVGSSQGIQALLARTEIQTAHDALATALRTSDTDATACARSAAPLTCETDADRTAADAFASFGQSLAETPVPSSAASAADQLLAVTLQAQQVFTDLAGATSASQYLETLRTADLSHTLDQFDADYTALEDALGAT